MSKRKRKAAERQKIERNKIKKRIIFDHILPSSVWMSYGHVSSTATPPGNPTWVGWRRTSAGTHLIVIPAGGRHGSPSPSARGHSVKPAVSTAGPAPTDGEPSNEPAAASPLFKHHCETTVFIRFIVEVRVIWLRTALNGSLKGRQMEMKNTLLLSTTNIYNAKRILCASPTKCRMTWLRYILILQTPSFLGI